MNAAWIDEALCAQVGGDAWMPDKGGPTRQAKRVCNGHDDTPPCPVRERCLAYALDNDIRDGIWGGTSPGQRRAMRKAAA